MLQSGGKRYILRNIAIFIRYTRIFAIYLRKQKGQPGKYAFGNPLSHWWMIRQMPLRVRSNEVMNAFVPRQSSFRSGTKRPINATHLLYFAQYCYMFKLYFRKSCQNHYNTTLYVSKQRLFLLYLLQYCYNISIYYTILRQE